MKTDWVNTAEACQKLGISNDTLYRWISQKKLRKGKHYRDISMGAVRKTYQWNLQQIERLFEK